MVSQVDHKNVADVMEHGLGAYRDESVVDRYAQQTKIYEGESRLLESFHERIQGKKMLEIGVGAGRVTPRLIELCDNYIGIDYSPEMVAMCNQRFPGLNFSIGDIRDLSEFEDETFEVIIFSMNGIDHLDAKGRSLALKEVNRILKPGHLWIFSSHNLNSKIVRPYQPPRPVFGLHPTQVIRENFTRIRTYCQNLKNHLRNRRHEYWTKDYAIVSDSAHEFRSLMYYTSVPHQVEQLNAHGFQMLQAYALHGRELGTPTEPASQSSTVYFVSEKCNEIEDEN